MKKIIVLFCVFFTVFLFYNFTKTTNKDEKGTPAVIVIRHATDVPDGGEHPDHNPFEFGKTIAVSIDGVNKPVEKNDSVSIPIFKNLLCNNSGYKRANDLSIGLEQFIENNNFTSVSDVITINPPKDYDSGTPNPFLTIAPYVTSQQSKTKGLPNDQLKLTLYNSHDYDEKRFDGNTLIKDGYSTIISWEATGMWQVVRKGGYNEATILPQLVNEEQIDLVKPKPIWGTTIYAFTNIKNNRFDLQKYDFSVEENNGDKKYIFTKCDGEGQKKCINEKPACEKN